jgi:hypothetical protein
MELDVGQLAGRVAFVVGSDLDGAHSESFLHVRRRAGLAAGSRIELRAARVTGLTTVDGLGAFACDQHAGVPVFTIDYSSALTFLSVDKTSTASAKLAPIRARCDHE